MKRTSVLVLAILLSVLSMGWSQDRLLVTVKRDYAVPARENVKIVLDWKKMQKMLLSVAPSHVRVTDQHFGNAITSMELSPEGQLMFDFEFSSNEPVWTFKVTADGKDNRATQSSNVVTDKKFVISYLKPIQPNIKNVSDKIIQSTINAYPDPSKLSIISPGKWTYEYGFFLNAMAKAPEPNGRKYFEYMKGWVDSFLTPTGEWKAGVYDPTEYKLDDILPGRLC